MSGAWNYIKAINTGKDIIKNGEIDDKGYDPYITNRNFSLYIDTVMYANEINKCYQLDKKPQFDYYLNSLRPRNRYVKWPKKEKVEDIDAIMTHYQVNYNKAKDIARILTPDQIDYLKTIIIKGGVNGK